MLKRFNRLLATAAALLVGFGIHAEPSAAPPAEVPNRTAAPTPGGDKAAIIERATRRAALANARVAAAARAQAALKAKGGKIDPKMLGVNPAASQTFKGGPATGLAAKGGDTPAGIVVGPGTGIPEPGFNLAQPDYMFNTASNWHNTKPIRKFVDTLPGLGKANANNLGNFIPVATPDTTMYPGSDYYQIGVVEYTQQLHSDLSATKLRGYKDLSPTAEVTTNGLNSSNYLGPVLIAHRDRPVRVKMSNLLPTGPVNPATGRRPGDLFLPVDTTMMGAGVGPLGGTELYPQNRAEFHLHGGLNPWISDGTPHQWITPAGETNMTGTGLTPYPKGAAFQNVPDMGAGTPGDGIATYFYTNQQSGRFMFYHDHAFGMTRLNVYAGEAAGYLIVDPVDDQLIAKGILPNNGGGLYTYGIPLVIQDKTFVDTTTLGTVGNASPDPLTGVTTATDPTWSVSAYGGDGSLWYPHVYMVNQNPADLSGANAMGRWDYGPWFWPPLTAAAGLVHGEEPVIGDPNGTTYPGTPNPSLVPEAFMDTPVVNGTAYPTLAVQPQAYRFRILNAANDRFLNLSFFQADPLGYIDPASGKPTEVKMVIAAPQPPVVPPAVSTWPATWPTDGRAGGVPDPLTAGPSFIQIGNESGFLPTPTIIAPQPVAYNYNRRDIVVLNVQERGLFMGPAMRADVIVDFSAYAGKRLILYNDAPAPVPAFDTRLDYYTGDPDQRDSGGANTTLPGYGPNTRTVMAFDVAAGPGVPFDITPTGPLFTAFNSTDSTQGAFAASQHPPIIPQVAYNSAMNKTVTTDVVSRIQDYQARYPFASTENGDLVQPYFESKAIQELFELEYGRMNATLGVELPFTNFNIQTTIPLGYSDPSTEYLTDGTTQFWKITHNGVDSHPVHFHLFDVQIMNRVGWDGAVRMPEPNELGWRETVLMNPLEDIVVAFRPISPRLPFKLPNSLHSPNVTQAANANLSVVNPVDGNAITISNAAIDFGWEYVWHCHILGHEENDFMRAMVLNVATAAPNAPSMLAASVHATAATRADLTWADNSTNETGFSIQRRPSATAGPFVEIATVVPNVRSFSDYNLTAGTAYDYQVMAYNQAGASAPSNGAAVNAVPATVQITGTIGNAPGLSATITFTNTNPVITAASDPITGIYTATVPYLYTGSIVPTLAGYYFFPVSRSLSNVNVAQTLQDFTALPDNLITISGRVTNAAGGLGGTTMALTGQPNVLSRAGAAVNPLTGTYSFTVQVPFTGTLTATRAGSFFTPEAVTFTTTTTSQVQNFTAVASRNVSGRVTAAGVNLAGVTLTYTSTNLPPVPTFTTVTTAAAFGANYSHIVPTGWSGTITASLAGYAFTPASHTLTNVITNIGAGINTNFTAQKLVTITGSVTTNGSPMSAIVVTASGATGGTATTDRTGTYSLTVNSGWTGTLSAVPPASTSTVLSPANLAVLAPVAVTVSIPVTIPATQNFISIQNISGVTLNTLTGANVPGVTLTLSGTFAGSVVTNASPTGNNYSIWVPTGFTGTITPSGPLVPLGLPATWTPASVNYTSLYADISRLVFNGN